MSSNTVCAIALCEGGPVGGLGWWRGTTSPPLLPTHIPAARENSLAASAIIIIQSLTMYNPTALAKETSLLHGPYFKPQCSPSNSVRPLFLCHVKFHINYSSPSTSKDYNITPASTSAHLVREIPIFLFALGLRIPTTFDKHLGSILYK
jgi:hypothetical protein